ncbi:MAG TPA: four helix bundle protein [Candidatus Saccharimonadales bacterium]|nr:four helix bundle protein [Candidatus Saccharimonadales bacterium]
MDDLIVFRKTYEYLVWLRPGVQRFARVHRYSLGAETEQSALRLLRHIIRANYQTAKRTDIEAAIVEYEVQRIYLRLAFEYRCLSERQFAYGSGRLDEIGRLLRGWARKK